MMSTAASRGWKEEEEEDAALGMELLPVEVLSNILGRLPTVALVRCRSVSRKWNRAVLGQGLAAGAPNSPCWCLLVCRLMDQRFPGLPVTHCYALDPRSGVWHRMKLPCPPSSRRVHLFRSAAAASGLLAFRDVQRGSKPLAMVYWVGNPMTNRWRQITPPPACPADRTKRFISDELLFHEASKSYTLMRFQRMESITHSPPHYTWVSQLWESGRREWIHGASTSGDWCDPAAFYTASTCAAHGVVYFLQVSHDALLVQLIAYDVQQERFRVAIPCAPVCCTDGALSAHCFQLFVNQDGEVECVAGITNGMRGFLLPGYGYPLDRLGVLKYLCASHRWVMDEGTEVDIVDCFRDARTDACTSFQVTAGTGCLYLASHDVYFANLVLYDAAMKKWSRMPDPFHRPDVLVPHKACQWQQSIGTFIPRLDVDP